jgi:hypothetical protein
MPVYSSEFHCIGQTEAIQSAENNIKVLRDQIHDKSSFWISRQQIREYIQNIQYSDTELKYKTGILAKWTCAAGSDCYVGIEVDCNGNSGTWIFAD